MPGSVHATDQYGRTLKPDFTPSQYDTDLTMNNTAQGVALATSASKLFIINGGATGKAIRVAFGTSEGNAGDNLTIVSGAATTGHYIPSPADGYGSCVLGVPAGATHYAVANAVAGDTQVVYITQGV